MMNYFIKGLKNYATFSGRARRKEYWSFALIHFLGAMALLVSGFFVPELTLLYPAWCLLLFLPALAVSVRRMHDTGRSGWYLLIPIYSLILTCTEGTREENVYGPDPKVNNEGWDFDKQGEADL